MYVWTISGMQFVRTLQPCMGLVLFSEAMTSVGNASRFVVLASANSNTLVFDVTDALNV